MQQENTQHREHSAASSYSPGTGDAGLELLERAPAQVVHGSTDRSLPIAGLTVAEVREQFGDEIHLDPRSVAFLDRHQVTDESTVVRPGQLLLFIRRAGEKGVPV